MSDPHRFLARFGAHTTCVECGGEEGDDAKHLAFIIDESDPAYSEVARAYELFLHHKRHEIKAAAIMDVKAWLFGIPDDRGEG